MLLLFVSYLLCGSAYGFYCEPRWMLFENNCYRRLEEFPNVHAQTCRNLGSQLVGTVTGIEKVFIEFLKEGGPLCNKRGDFVCKKAASKTPIIPPKKRPDPRHEIDCASMRGWYGLKSTNKCYASFFSSLPLTWSQANDRCKNIFGGTLAMMKSELEYNHVINVGHKGTKALPYENPMIGLRRDGATWKWVDGSQGGFMPFNVGEPSNGGSSACTLLTTDVTINSRMATLYNGQFGKINDNACDMLLQYFICSVDQPDFVARFAG